MSLDPKLLEVLVCPEDKQSLYFIEDESVLFNPRLRRTYAVRDGIPVMLIDEATAVDDTEVERLEAKVESSGIEPTGQGGGA